MVGRILLAVDGSDPSNRAIPFTAEMARCLGAEIVVFHAKEHVAGRGAPYDAEADADASVLTDHAVRWLKDEGLAARSETRSCYFGHVPREIVRIAEDERADLIVLGSRGQSDLGATILGNVTCKVLQLSEVPILIVR
jgi:nucleotide-binding universal stress UspA family protein